MSVSFFPLKWEATGNQWWYASPIDCAAANAHYHLVREMLKFDNNHLFNLTSLRRIRRLELVWDDDREQFKDVAKCRSEVARKLFLECESKKGKKKENSLIRAGYGGWLMYTAASAGDLCFVQQLVEMNPLLVFGGGEYTVTDTFYAASKGKNCEVFKLVFDFALSPRFVTGKGRVILPSVYKWEMSNRAVHTASRGGNAEVLEMFLANCCDVLAYRDAQGSTVLHSAAATGQLEVVKYLTSSFDIINSTDDHGDTALHVAAYRGHLAVVETLISASSSLISIRNHAGETFLHKAVSGFQSPAFRRLDRQVELLRKLLSGDKKFHMEEIINAKNTDGETALQVATTGNTKIPTDLIKLLKTAPMIKPLQGLGYNSRKATTASSSQMKNDRICISPGTSFRMSDAKMLVLAGIEKNASDASSNTDQGSERMSSTTSDSAAENRPSRGTNQ
ncbi:unnamed protein product [Lathyrus sativus]|nr:unnamed protein product [Lathyrus sativus]